MTLYFCEIGTMKRYNLTCFMLVNLRRIWTILILILLAFQEGSSNAGSKVVFSQTLNHNIEFRRARPEDVGSIVNIYSQLLPEDANLLLQYPSQVVTSLFEETVQAGKLFVVTSAETGEILSFLKAYIISEYELDNFTKSELADAIKDEPKVVSFSQYMDPPANDKLKFKQSKVSFDPTDTSFKRGFRLDSHHQIFFYYGSAYTVKHLRGKGLSSDLLGYAFSESEAALIEHLKQGDQIHQIILVYGQSGPNLGNDSMIFEFHNFMVSLEKTASLINQTSGFKLGLLFQISYEAYQPILTFSDSEGLQYHRMESPEKRGAITLISQQLNY